MSVAKYFLPLIFSTLLVIFVAMEGGGTLDINVHQNSAKKYLVNSIYFKSVNGSKLSICVTLGNNG